jgi:putative ABC transport system permease protein
MTLRDLLADTFRTLWAHKLRTFLSMFGIAWGIISITLMVAGVNGLNVGLRKQQESFGKDIMIVFSGTTSLQAGGMRSGRKLRWDADDYWRVAEQAPSCKYVLPEIENEADIRSLNNSAKLPVTGSLPPFAGVRSIGIAEGRFYNDEDNASATRVAFLGSDVKKQLFGNRPALGATIWMNDIPYNVIGVMKAKDQNSNYNGPDIQKIFVPYSAALRDFPNLPPLPPHCIDQMIVVPQSLALHKSCEGETRRALGLLHDFDPHDKEAAQIWDTIKGAEANQLIFDGMEYFLGAVGLTTLLLGGLGVMNVMLVAVRERTREIGVRKALGATRRSILTQFFIETIIVAFLSGVLGMVLSYGLCGLVDLLPMPPFFAGLLPTWSSGVISFALLAAIAVASAIYPANRAASVDPIEALRFEAGG